MSNKELDSLYSPSDDTFLLINSLPNYSSENVLEIGIGSGAILLNLIQKNKYVLGTDVNHLILRNTLKDIKKKYCGQGLNIVCCESASAFRDEIFDLVIFNPPYLPSNEIRDITVDGGRTGLEVTKSWFKESARCLKSTGVIIFIYSSVSDINILISYIENLRFKTKVLSSKRLFFERLYVLEARKQF
jgi:release factor glutamine methyltransferase